MARGVKGGDPLGAVPAIPMVSSTFSRTASREIPSDSSALAATPSPSWIRPEEDVLGADKAVVQQPRLFLREHQHPPCPVGETFEHPDRLSLFPLLLGSVYLWH